MLLDLLLAPPRLSLMSLEVGRSLLLDLVGQGVDLEAVQAGDKLVGRSLWPHLGPPPFCKKVRGQHLCLAVTVRSSLHPKTNRYWGLSDFS